MHNYVTSKNIIHNGSGGLPRPYRAAAAGKTSCVGGRHNMHLAPLTLWPWKCVRVTCDAGYLCRL